jgi:hypothetical protein
LLDSRLYKDQLNFFEPGENALFDRHFIKRVGQAGVSVQAFDEVRNFLSLWPISAAGQSRPAGYRLDIRFAHPMRTFRSRARMSAKCQIREVANLKSRPRWLLNSSSMVLDQVAINTGFDFRR